MPIPLVTHPEYSYPFPASHRFPMEKFGLLHEHLKAQGIATHTNTFRPGRCLDAVLALAHCPDYLKRFMSNTLSSKEQRRLGLPWSKGLVRRTCISPNGTLLTAQLALKHGVACHLAGGTHHAHRDFGSGFCIVNDLAITALALLALGKTKRILIFDCDVHQGDGTATLLANTPEAFTCSIHCAQNFPARKASSDWDIELPKGTTDERYLEAVHATLHQTLVKVQPDLVLYDAGVDVFEHDPLGLLDITEQGIRARELGLVDETGTSDEVIMAACDTRDVYHVAYEKRKKLADK